MTVPSPSVSIDLKTFFWTFQFPSPVSCSNFLRKPQCQLPQYISSNWPFREASPLPWTRQKTTSRQSRDPYLQKTPPPRPWCRNITISAISRFLEFPFVVCDIFGRPKVELLRLLVKQFCTISVHVFLSLFMRCASIETTAIADINFKKAKVFLNTTAFNTIWLPCTTNIVLEVIFTSMIQKHIVDLTWKFCSQQSWAPDATPLCPASRPHSCPLSQTSSPPEHFCPWSFWPPNYFSHLNIFATWSKYVGHLNIALDFFFLSGIPHMAIFGANDLLQQPLLVIMVKNRQPC